MRITVCRVFLRIKKSTLVTALFLFLFTAGPLPLFAQGKTLFPVESRNGKDNIRGGCWPSYLPIRLAQNNIEISVSDLEKKQYLFP